jgi:ribonuclease I
VTEGLHIHEWRKHGRCTGLSGSDYYRVAIHYTEQANAALGASIRRHAGRAVSAATLRAEADAARPRFGQSIVFVCKNLRSRDPAKRGRTYLTEVRVCLDEGASGGSEALLACAAIPRRDQGCDQEFWIDEP